jgi:hypothetical protein
MRWNYPGRNRWSLNRRRLGCRHLGGGFATTGLQEVGAHELGVINIDRTRMRLLLCDAHLREIFEDYPCLDLEFSRQLVDADLRYVTHR